MDYRLTSVLTTTPCTQHMRLWWLYWMCVPPAWSPFTWNKWSHLNECCSKQTNITSSTSGNATHRTRLGSKENLGVNLLVGVDSCAEQNGASRGLKFQCVYMHLFRQVIVGSGVRQLFNWNQSHSLITRGTWFLKWLKNAVLKGVFIFCIPRFLQVRQKQT